MKRIKRILLLIPNLDFGGAQRAFYYLSRELSEDYEVYECVFNQNGGVAFPSESQLYDLGIPAGKNMFDKGYRFLQRILRVKKLKKKLGIDITISMLEGADYVNILSRHRDLIWLCVQGSKSFDRDMRYEALSKKFLIPFFYKKADRIVAVSEGIRNELVKQFNISDRKVVVIENAVDRKMVDQKMSEPLSNLYKELFYANRVIATSGRLHNQKNQLPLFDVYAELYRTDPQIKMIIIGDGPLKQEMENRAKEFDFSTYFQWRGGEPTGSESVFFLGYQDNPFKYIYNANLFIFPSLWEGYPLALLEAMACAVPVLSSDCPTGPRQILAPDNLKDAYELEQLEVGKYGILLPLITQRGYSNSVRVWAQAILHFINDQEFVSKYRKRSRLRADEFSVEVIGSRWKAELENYKQLKENQRTLECIRFHYEVEKELANRLRVADKKERMHLYSSVYNELFTRVADHPQIVQKGDIKAQQQAVNWQIKLLKPLLSQEKTFMEIGSGDCSLSFAATKYSKYVYAVDVSEEIVRNSATPRNFKLVISDGVSIPVPESSIDVCYSNQLMEHLHPDDAFDQLRNIYTALSEGGKYLCITPNKLAGPHDVSKYFDKEATGFHLKEYTTIELNKLFKDAGFSSVKTIFSFKNNIWIIPVAVVGFIERVLSLFPRNIRRRLALNPLVNRVLGIYIIGYKKNT